jgi:hypothetical protein
MYAARIHSYSRSLANPFEYLVLKFAIPVRIS